MSLYSEPIFNYETPVYICKKLPSTQDEYMNEVENYDKPNERPFLWNVQPATADSEVREFGQLANSMRVATISKSLFNGKFKEFDKVYIENKPSSNESFYGENADYRVYSIRPQNACIRIYFLKLVKNQ